MPSEKFKLILLLMSLMVLASCKPGKKDELRVKSKVVSVQYTIATPGTLSNTLKVTGSLMASEKIDLYSEVSGKVVSINFEEGSQVSRGQLLIKIKDNELKAQLKKLQSQESLYRIDEQRKKKLLEINGISQEEYDQAKTLLENTGADIAVVQAQIEKTEIVAPFSGTIGLRAVSLGSYVNPSTLIASLQETDPIKLEFAVPERYASQVKRGTPVIFKVEGSQQPLEATVYAAESYIDPGTRSLLIRARCKNPGNTLRPGAYAEVEVFLGKEANSIVLPAQALMPYLKGYRVFTCENNLAKACDVTTGMRTDSAVEVVSGIKASDTVILTGLMQLRDGSQVKAVSAK